MFENFKIFITLIVEIIVFWVVIPCSLLGGNDVSEERTCSTVLWPWKRRFLYSPFLLARTGLHVLSPLVTLSDSHAVSFFTLPIRHPTHFNLRTEATGSSETSISAFKITRYHDQSTTVSISSWREKCARCFMVNLTLSCPLSKSARYSR
jgi:hypothetical protein